ncbi:MAG: hypothetical protein ACTSUE_21585 [Promethearchaeota archaeon]
MREGCEPPYFSFINAVSSYKSMNMTFNMPRMESSTFERHLIARDLKKDLKQLKRNGVDPKSFLKGVFYHLVASLEE